VENPLPRVAKWVGGVQGVGGRGGRVNLVLGMEAVPQLQLET